MKTRHRAREVALQILYRYDSESTAAAAPAAKPSNSPVKPLPQADAKPAPVKVPAEGKALSDELIRHFDHFQVPAPTREFAAELVAGTLKNIEKLDALLERHALNWKVSRMGSIDRTLLRMAAYELQNFPEIPASVTMDEAIELSKQFGTAESPSFINGILDAIAREKTAASPEAGSASDDSAEDTEEPEDAE